MRLGERAVELSGIAASLLGWRPTEFWDSTPAELAAALGVSQRADELMDRTAIDRLLHLFPDNRDA